jgi:hypothetical protein
MRLSLESLTDDFIDGYGDLSRSEYSDVNLCSPEHFRWKHLDNPAGPSLAYNLYSDDRLVGRLVYQKQRFMQNNQAFVGAYLVDLLIHPDYRNIKAFVALMSKFKEVRGFDFLYLTPGVMSIPLYRRALGLDDLFSLDAYATPLRFGALLQRLLKRRFAVVDWIVSGAWRITAKILARCLDLFSQPSLDETPPTEEDFRSLLTLVEYRDELHGDRSHAFHRWRFFDSPHNQYKVVYLRKRGTLVGYVVTRVMTYEGLKTLFLIDYLCDQNLKGVAHAKVLFYCVLEGQRRGCDILFTLVNAAVGYGRAICRFPLMRVPEKFLPQEVPMFFVDLTPEKPKTVDRQRFAVTLADLDVF